MSEKQEDKIKDALRKVYAAQNDLFDVMGQSKLPWNNAPAIGNDTFAELYLQMSGNLGIEVRPQFMGESIKMNLDDAVRLANWILSVAASTKEP